MDKVIENLNKYLKNSERNMSSFGKSLILNANYQNIEEGMNMCARTCKIGQPSSI